MHPTSRLIPRWPACLLLGLGLLLMPGAHAACTKAPPHILSAQIPAAATIPFGRINLANASLQPPGTLLASVAVPSIMYTYSGANADTVLWTCDQRDIDQKKVYFLVSVNADSRYAGWHEIKEDALPKGVYATWFDYVGLRLSIGNVTLGRYWQRVELPPIEADEHGKINIRLQHVPTLQAELYRHSWPTPETGTEHGCLPVLRTPPVPTGTLYGCNEPSGYIQLAGPGLEWAHDPVGGDHRIGPWNFWAFDNGFGYTLYHALTLGNTATCAVNSVDRQYVRFKPMSTQQLLAGDQASETINLIVACDNRDISGTGSNQTAIGLQVSPGAFAAAQRLEPGLLKGGGVEFLLSDHYGNPGVARGVGIGLFDRDDQPRRFVGMPGTVDHTIPGWREDIVKHAHPKGPDAGWYPVLEKANLVNISATGHYLYLYEIRFKVKLMKLPQASEVTPGKVHATAHVLVKVQ